jgi:ribosomal protein S13
MARIAGRYPEKQESVIALTYIFGLGRAIEVLEKAPQDKSSRLE